MSENLEPLVSLFQALFSQIGIEGVHGIPFGILIGITILTLFFLVIFIRTIALAWNLGSLAKKLRSQEKSAKLPSIGQFSKNSLYAHLWSEYEETLHELKRKDGGVDLRSTLPAEAFFSKEVMVDSRGFVWNDFFRHLPGILTGLGIIGTFFGLIGGLEGFAPSEEAAAARESLTNLLEGVMEAFKVSAVAISAAILVTLLEKWSLAWAYKNVEKVTHAIDSLYDAGAGEEYLARMVEADESNLANSQQLKDAMVNELSVILREMTDRQIEAQEKNNLILAQSIQTPLEGMVSKLEDVGAAVKGGSKNNTETMKSALDELVTGFVDKMDETLNVSMQKIAGSMEYSARSMTEMQASMDTMIDKISSTSDQAITGMVEKLEVAIERTASNQEQMTKQMEEFVLGLQQQISTEREATSAQQQSSMNIVAAQQKNNLDRLFENQSQMTQQIEAFVSGLQKQISEDRNAVNAEQSLIRAKAAEEHKLGLEKSAENQAEMMNQMRSFVSELQAQIKSEREAGNAEQASRRERAAKDEEISLARASENQNQLMGQLEKLASNLQAQIKSDREANNAEQDSRRDLAAAESKKHQDILNAEFNKVLDKLGQAITAIENNIIGINTTATNAIKGMNQGADSMKTAADQFSSAGRSVTGVLDKASPLAQELKNASQTLITSNQQSTEMFNKYLKLKENTDLQVQEFGNLVLTVQKESSDRQQLVADLNVITEKLRDNERESVEYLKVITKELQNSYESFGSSMNKQVTDVFSNTNKHIEGAVNNIAGAVENLDRLAQVMSQAAKGRV